MTDKKKAQEKINELKATIMELEKVVNAPADLFKIGADYPSICRALKEYEVKSEHFSNLFTPEEIEFHVAVAQLKQVQKFFNEDWILDWTDHDQQKWYPYHENDKKGGLVFYHSAYGSYFSDGQVAYFKDQKTSDFVGKNYAHLYKIIQR